MLQADPSLEGVGLVIFDEFHERSLDADLALALCTYARNVFREDPATQTAGDVGDPGWRRGGRVVKPCTCPSQ